MTRDEQRAACIKAMERAFYERSSSGEPTSVYNCMVAAFDALNGLVRVCPVEATLEMMARATDTIYAGDDAEAAAVYELMSATGDLTDPPEKKT